ncbi:MAG: hypothetical protein ABIJ45_11740 [Candidatus Zixiibacteriota bacterium]
MRIYRILIVLALVCIVYFGVKYYLSSQEVKHLKEYEKYATAIAEVSLAAELYRADPDSFLMVRDSILNQSHLTGDSIVSFRARLIDNKTEWKKIWELIQLKTDSLVDNRLSQFNIIKIDSISDSIK